MLEANERSGFSGHMTADTGRFALALFVSKVTNGKPFGVLFVVMTPQAHGSRIVSLITVIDIMIRRTGRTLNQSKKARCLFEEHLLPFAFGVGGVEIFRLGVDHVGIGLGVFGDAFNPVTALTGDRLLLLYGILYGKPFAIFEGVIRGGMALSASIFPLFFVGMFVPDCFVDRIIEDRSVGMHGMLIFSIDHRMASLAGGVFQLGVSQKR